MQHAGHRGRGDGQIREGGKHVPVRGRDNNEVESSRSRLRAVAAHIRPGSFPLLFAAMLLLYVLNGLAIDTPIGAVPVQLGHAAVICASIYVLSASRVTVWVGLPLAAMSLALAAHLWTPVLPMSRVLQDSIASGFLLWVLGVVLRDVFRRTTPERDAVIGALSGFMLILTVFM